MHILNEVPSFSRMCNVHVKECLNMISKTFRCDRTTHISKNSLTIMGFNSTGLRNPTAGTFLIETLTRISE